jgi:O-antigen/teichoic acid export membrane protein
LNIALARIVSPKEYGIFAFTFTILLILQIFQTSFFIEPMFIYAIKRYELRMNSYINKIKRMNFLFFSLIAIAICLFTYFFFDKDYFSAFIGLGVSLVFITQNWFLRKSCYIKLNIRISAISGLVYLLIMIVGLYLFYILNILSSFSAFVILAVASLCSTVVMSSKKDDNSLTNQNRIDDEVLTLHINYGKWSIVANLVNWIPINIYSFILPIFRDFTSVGYLRANFNLIAPFSQFLFAINNLIFPLLIRAINGEKNNYRILIIGLNIFAFVYSILLLVFGKSIFFFLYKGKFEFSFIIVTLMSLIPIISIFTILLTNTLRALEKPRDIVSANFISLLFVGTIGVLLISFYAVLGVYISIIISYLITLFVLLYKTKTQRNAVN